MWQITASLRRRCYLWTRFLLESDGKEALWGDIREIRLEQVGQESGKGFSMEGIDLTFGLGGSLTPEHLEITHKASNGLIFLSNFQFTIPRYS